MNQKIVGVKIVALLLAVFCIAAGVFFGSYFKDGVFLGPYLVSKFERPVYFEFPVMGGANQSYGNGAFSPGLHAVAKYGTVAVYDIDQADLLSVKPYPLSQSFPNPLSMGIRLWDAGVVKKADILNIGPKGGIIFQFLKNNGVFEGDGDYLRIAGKRITLHMAAINQLDQDLVLPVINVLNEASTVPIDDVRKVVEYQPRHPQFALNRGRLALYKLASGYAWLITYNEILLAAIGILALVWLLVSKSPTLFLFWWVIVGVYSISWRCLCNWSILHWAWDHKVFGHYLFSNPIPMSGTYSPLPHIVCMVGFLLIGPIILVYMGSRYATKYLMPKHDNPV